jgi:hypothetical protein
MLVCLKGVVVVVLVENRCRYLNHWYDQGSSINNDSTPATDNWGLSTLTIKPFLMSV